MSAARDSDSIRFLPHVLIADIKNLLATLINHANECPGIESFRVSIIGDLQAKRDSIIQYDPNLYYRFYSEDGDDFFYLVAEKVKDDITKVLSGETKEALSYHSGTKAFETGKKVGELVTLHIQRHRNVHLMLDEKKEITETYRTLVDQDYERPHFIANLPPMSDASGKFLLAASAAYELYNLYEETINYFLKIKKHQLDQIKLVKPSLKFKENTGKKSTSSDPNEYVDLVDYGIELNQFGFYFDKIPSIDFDPKRQNKDWGSSMISLRNWAEKMTAKIQNEIHNISKIKIKTAGVAEVKEPIKRPSKTEDKQFAKLLQAFAKNEKDLELLFKACDFKNISDSESMHLALAEWAWSVLSCLTSFVQIASLPSEQSKLLTLFFQRLTVLHFNADQASEKHDYSEKHLLEFRNHINSLMDMDFYKKGLPRMLKEQFEVIKSSLDNIVQKLKLDQQSKSESKKNP